jgi:hypothetical protein
MCMTSGPAAINTPTRGAAFGELVHTWLGFPDRGVYLSRPEGGWSDAQEYPPDVVSLGVA